MTRILIGTPTGNHTVSDVYTHSIFNLIQDNKSSFELEIVDSCDLYKCRSYLAHKAIKGNYSHLLFIDSDIGFNSAAIEKMINFDQPFVGCLCPSRNVENKFICSDQLIVGTEYDGFMQSNLIGTGILLLQTTVLEQIREKFPHLYTSTSHGYYTSKGITEPVHQCFASMINNDGDYLSEDVSFCHRWKQCGGTVWVCVDEPVIHQGVKTYSGVYIK